RRALSLSGVVPVSRAGRHGRRLPGRICGGLASVNDAQSIGCTGTLEVAYGILTLLFAYRYTERIEETVHLEDLHATLRDRFEADQRAAPAYRVLPPGVPQAPSMF